MTGWRSTRASGMSGTPVAPKRYGNALGTAEFDPTQTSTEGAILGSLMISTALRDEKKTEVRHTGHGTAESPPYWPLSSKGGSLDQDFGRNGKSHGGNLGSRRSLVGRRLAPLETGGRA